MPARISPSLYGARAAKELLYRIRRVNLSKGEIDLPKVYALLEEALEDPRSRRGVLMVLAEYLSVALEGSTIRLQDWTPLEAFDPDSQAPPRSIKRF